MWTKTVQFSQIQKRARWKVEFFCSDGPFKSEAAYDSTPLREVFYERGETIDPQSYADHVFNYLGLENVQSLTGDLIDYKPKSGNEVLSRSKIFRRGDILYGRLRPYLNKVFLAANEFTEGICSGEFYVLVPDSSRILPNFARSLLASKYVQESVVGLLTGSALPRLQLDDLLAIEIPLPPLDKQQVFEQFIIRLDEQRRDLLQQLTGFPEATIDAVINALESRSKPIILTRKNNHKSTGAYDNPLPQGDYHKGKKGRNLNGHQSLLKFS
jgi:restriction endonuclease S subunit